MKFSDYPTEATSSPNDLLLMSDDSTGKTRSIKVQTFMSSLGAGPKGDTGEQGPVGPIGPKGEDGVAGAQGPIGLTGTNGSDGATGPKGEIGPTGPTGPKGDDGVQGPQGPKGDGGLIGQRGYTGPKGDRGDSGVQGIKGDTGSQGEIGPTGPVGPQGVKGDTGAQGIQGPAGPKGDTGNTGPDGLTGPTGPAGSGGINFETLTKANSVNAEDYFLAHNQVLGDFAIEKTKLALSLGGGGSSGINFNDLSKSENIDATDKLLIGNGQSNTYIFIHELLPKLYDITSDSSKAYINRRTFVRGKYLGETMTEDQFQSISLGTFNDLYLGDYWSKHGTNWRIVDFDYYNGIYYNDGQSQLTSHHIVIMPDDGFVEKTMLNDGDPVIGGQDMSIWLYSCWSDIELVFGPRVSHAIFCPDAFITNVQTIEEIIYQIGLPNSYMVFGNGPFDSIPTSSREQLALFRIAPEFISSGTSSYWIRDIMNSTNRYVVHERKMKSKNMSEYAPVRPVFFIGPNS